MYTTQFSGSAARTTSTTLTSAVTAGERSGDRAGKPARHGYPERETGVGYGRSSGYAARDGYKGRNYVTTVVPSLFRFS